MPRQKEGQTEGWADPISLDLFHSSINDNAIASVKGNDYRIDFWYMSKDQAINIMKNSQLKEKVHHCKNIKNNLFLI